MALHHVFCLGGNIDYRLWVATFRFGWLLFWVGLGLGKKNISELYSELVSYWSIMRRAPDLVDCFLGWIRLELEIHSSELNSGCSITKMDLDLVCCFLGCIRLRLEKDGYWLGWSSFALYYAWVRKFFIWFEFQVGFRLGCQLTWLNPSLIVLKIYVDYKILYVFVY